MRLGLPATSEELMAGFRSKLRSQVKKALTVPVEVSFGREELLTQFYRVFAINMRDLGTPVFPQRLFREVLQHFPNEAELCVLRHEGVPVSGALLIHTASKVTQVPSASSLKSHNHLNVNMNLYWRLLSRTIERGQSTFDFGRSSPESGTHKFKEQWGAQPSAAMWQRVQMSDGPSSAPRKESKKMQRLIEIWKRIPVLVTRWIGPPIVRGIP